MSLYTLCPRCGTVRRDRDPHQCPRRSLPPMPMRRSQIPAAIGLALVLAGALTVLQLLLGGPQ